MMESFVPPLVILHGPRDGTYVMEMADALRRLGAPAEAIDWDRAGDALPSLLPLDAAWVLVPPPPTKGGGLPDGVLRAIVSVQPSGGLVALVLGRRPLPDELRDAATIRGSSDDPQGAARALFEHGRRSAPQEPSAASQQTVEQTTSGRGGPERAAPGRTPPPP
ncbi:MAG TPA: hypothetical protein PKA64_22755, partial [Myxococcota bacterium]|nr:hypothetical protein [Myxococcota bacterium]